MRCRPPGTAGLDRRGPGPALGRPAGRADRDRVHLPRRLPGHQGCGTSRRRRRDPEVITTAEAAAGPVPGVIHAHARARWTGRTLRIEIEGWVDPELTAKDADAHGGPVAGQVAPAPRGRQPHLDHAGSTQDHVPLTSLAAASTGQPRLPTATQTARSEPMTRLCGQPSKLAKRVRSLRPPSASRGGAPGHLTVYCAACPGAGRCGTGRGARGGSCGYGHTPRGFLESRTSAAAAKYTRKTAARRAQESPAPDARRQHFCVNAGGTPDGPPLRRVASLSYPGVGTEAGIAPVSGLRPGNRGSPPRRQPPVW
jgi:hypothetical protein